MSYNTPMFDMEPLIAELRAANVEDLARRSGVSSKTIYRIRQRSKHMPNIVTVMRLRGALADAASVDSRATEPSAESKAADAA